MKKFAWLLTLVLAFALVLSACGSPPPKPRSTEAPVEH